MTNSGEKYARIETSIASADLSETLPMTIDENDENSDVDVEYVDDDQRNNVQVTDSVAQLIKNQAEIIAMRALLQDVQMLKQVTNDFRTSICLEDLPCAETVYEKLKEIQPKFKLDENFGARAKHLNDEFRVIYMKLDLQIAQLKYKFALENLKNGRKMYPEFYFN